MDGAAGMPGCVGEDQGVKAGLPKLRPDLVWLWGEEDGIRKTGHGASVSWTRGLGRVSSAVRAHTILWHKKAREQLPQRMVKPGVAPVGWAVEGLGLVGMQSQFIGLKLRLVAPRRGWKPSSKA